MKSQVNERAITVSVGQFIREVRNGNKRPSMYNILFNNGVNSPERAKQLLERMVEHKIIHKHKDKTYSLCKENYDMAEVMPVLLKREYHRKPKAMVAVVQEEINPLSPFTAKDLVEELRNRGYEVKASRQVIMTEEL